jgi:hypothetical protein
MKTIPVLKKKLGGKSLELYKLQCALKIFLLFRAEAKGPLNARIISHVH